MMLAAIGHSALASSLPVRAGPRVSAPATFTLAALADAVDAQSLDELAVVMEEQELPPDLGLDPVPRDSLAALQAVIAALETAPPGGSGLRLRTLDGNADPVDPAPGQAEFFHRLEQLLSAVPVFDTALDAYVWSVGAADDSESGCADTAMAGSVPGSIAGSNSGRCDTLEIGAQGVWHALTLDGAR